MKDWKYLAYKVLKTALATVIAIKIAEYLEIKYYLTAGVVAIISLQGTIKETYKIGIERIVATTIGLILSGLLFSFLGVNYYVLGLFIIIFMPICIRFNLIQGFLVNVVLSLHLISENSSSIKLLVNEFGILMVGLLTAMAFNLYMPNLNKEINNIRKEIGEIMQKILMVMSQDLKCQCCSGGEDKYFAQLKELGNRGKNLSIEQHNNSILASSFNNFDYFRMRYIQYKILKRMKRSFIRIYNSGAPGVVIAELIEKICYTTFDTVDIEVVLTEIEKTKIQFKNSELPKNRDEFENRAILYDFLMDLEEFASVVLEYLKNYPRVKKIQE